MHVECIYGSWFDRELEWEEAAKKHPKNFYVLYYEDLKQVILHLSVSIIRPKPECNLSGLSGRAWIFPSFAGKSRHCLKTTGILSRRQFMTVFANVLEREVEKHSLLFVCMYVVFIPSENLDDTIICEGLLCSSVAVIEQ